jgi:putative tricarboxylic transport membrane protein
MADRVIFVCTLVLAAVYLYFTEQLPSLEIGDPLGPKAFPRLLGAGLVLTAIVMVFEMVRARKAAQAPDAAAAPADPVQRKATMVVAAAAVWTLLYFLVFETLGYVIATMLYLYPLMAYFNSGRQVMNALTAVLFSLGSYLMFVKILGVNLAPGLLPF